MMDFLFGWVLNLHPALGIFIVSMIISLVITLAIKFLTDQSLMKQLRNEMKELQQEIKDLKNNPKKMAKINDRFMETNMKYMSHSMRPTLFTFIPIILIFGWMSSHLGYMPIVPNEPFKMTLVFNEMARGNVTLQNITGEGGVDVIDGEKKEILHREVDYLLNGSVGEYVANFDYNGKIYPKEIIITKDRTYAPVEKIFKKGMFAKDEPRIEMIRLSNEKILPFQGIPVLGDIPWIGTWGWFGTYFLFSIIFSLVFRKVFDIH